MEQPTEPTRQKPRTLEDILLEFGPVGQVLYEPFQPEEPKRDATVHLPPTFPIRPHPYDYFALFFTPDLFETITRNTNQYTAIQRMCGEPGQREWSNMLTEELYVFIGTIIYMGVHEEPRISMYWNTDFDKGPLHSIPSHISLSRFEQIKRYCHISCSESDKRAGYHLTNNKRWWYKVEPLASTLQASFQQYYSPSSEVSIDELMVRCFGRLVS